SKAAVERRVQAHRGVPEVAAGRIRDLRPYGIDLECAPSRGEETMNDARASAPLRLADAERVNPYQLLLDLYDHAPGRSTASDQEEVLAESHRPRVGTGRSLTAA